MDFVVENGVPGAANPTGLRVEISGETGTGIPEPSTSLLAGFGLCGLAVALRRAHGIESRCMPETTNRFGGGDSTCA